MSGNYVAQPPINSRTHLLAMCARCGVEVADRKVHDADHARTDRLEAALARIEAAK